MRPTSGALLSLAVSTVVTMTIALSLRPRQVFGLSRTALLLLFVVRVLSFAVGDLLNYTGVRLAGVSRASPIVGASPLLATALAVAYGGESLNGPLLQRLDRVTARTVLGALLMLGGVALIAVGSE